MRLLRVLRNGRGRYITIRRGVSSCNGRQLQSRLTDLLKVLVFFPGIWIHVHVASNAHGGGLEGEG